MKTIEELKKVVKKDVRWHYSKGYLRPHAGDTLHEIADSHVPIYYNELIGILANDTSLAYVDEPDLCDPDKGVHGMIQVAIFERLIEQAWATWQEIQDEEE